MIPDVVRELGYLTLGTRLKRLGERLQAQTQGILDAHHDAIQSAQFPFLAAIDRLGPLTIGQLAEAVGVSQPGATRTVGQLAEAGLLEIATTADDLRRRSVTLTRQGKKLVETGKRESWPVIHAAVKALCAEAPGDLLAHLAAIEDGLAAVPLAKRVPVRRKAAR